MNSFLPKKLLYVGHTNPWGKFSGSGFSPKVCSMLKERGLLHGGVHPFDAASLRYINGDGYNSWVNRIKRRFVKRPDMGLAESESDGLLPRFFEQLEPGSPIIYHFHTPVYDERWEFKRYLFQDLTPTDAQLYNAYGHENISDAEIAQKRERIHAVVHSPHTAGILTYSTYGADSISREYGYPRQKIMPIGCGPVRSLGLPKNLSISRYEMGRILFVGRSWEKKGGPILLEAFKKLQESNNTRHAKLSIVGPKLQPQATVGMPGVEFLGRVSDKDVASAFKNASIFCMVPDCETWGIVYVEAANAGLPIVGFNRWALPDIVRHGETGLLISERNSEALAIGLATLISDPEKMLAMGIAANQRVNLVLGWDQVINKIISMIWPILMENVHIPSFQDEDVNLQ